MTEFPLMIEFQNLTKSFRVTQKDPGIKGSIASLIRRKWVEKQALKAVNAEIQAGEIVGLVGANGAGKTTLVKILSGIVHPTSGDANILGFRPWERDTEFRKQIALIMGQKAQLWWDLPAADCFLLLREIYQVPKPKFKASLDYLIESLGVGNELKTQIRRLSLGERMKMELIAALLHEPKIVFLDEPTIGLDLTSQNAIRKFLLEYRKKHQPVMIVTSHYMEDIERLCERIIIIREGAFVYDGPLAKVLAQHSGSKTLKVRLTDATDEKVKDRSWLGGLQVTELPSEPGTLKFHVEKSLVPKFAAKILEALPVDDLTIEEEDISVIIEKLIRRT